MSVTDTDRLFIDFSCPACGFHIELQLVEVRTNAFHWCPCCRTRIHLVDNDGSVDAGLKRIDKTLKGLLDCLRRFTK